MPTLVNIESPLAGDFARNIRYAKLCLLDSIKRGEAPYASHLLYPLILDDRVPNHRKLGMDAGFAWAAQAEVYAVYTDLGISSGMQAGMDRAVAAGKKVEMRTLPPEELARLDERLDATPGV